MKKTKSKNILTILIFSVCLFISIALACSGLVSSGGKSNMGVISPFVDGTVIIPDNSLVHWESPDYSNANLEPDTPYSNGVLRRYLFLGIYNQVRNETVSGFHFPQFVRYFEVARVDGRYIYDDDGILDTNSSEEVVNYPSMLYSTESTLPVKKDAGPFWTDHQPSFKNGDLEVNFYSNSTSSTFYYGVPRDPSNNFHSICYIIDKDCKPYISNPTKFNVYLNATGQYTNTFWGNTSGSYGMNFNMTYDISMAARDWNNSLKASTPSGTYKGKTIYYSPKEFTAIATNLNNLLKINDVQIDPLYGTTVVPFKDGHHITITDVGITKVDLENGSENNYTTYYCMIDNKLPDVSYNYSNTNALDLRKISSITTESSGAKTQTIYEGIFKDQVQVNFGANEDESPETATYTLNGETHNLTSGTWLKQEGSYVVTIKDSAGNTTISKFDIDCTNPFANLNRVKNDNNYKVAKWYLTTIPNGYSGYGTYSFLERADALNYACEIEKQNLVTEYNLERVEDFANTHLLAKGNSVKVGKYWYYKSIDNDQFYVYYFDENSLNQAIQHYAEKFVSVEHKYNINSSLTPNNYGNILDKSIYDNVVSKNGINAYMGNNFVFRTDSNMESYKIYCDYAEDSTEDYKELQYNKVFSTQVNGYGLYKIKEIDFVGHESYYYLFLDNQAPMLDIEAKIYGKDKLINQSISVNDIPNNGELIYYYESFKIAQVIEDDKWWIMEIKTPKDTVLRYTYLDELPNFGNLGAGEYSITIADRNSNKFNFKISLLGKAPEAVFQNINANTQLRIDIKCSEDYNSITEIKIYRNGICLNAENGYDEYPNLENDLIFINPSIKTYTFNKGGTYKVELTDIFGRSITYEYKFEKDLPVGDLIGVKHNGKTNSEVRFTYNSSKYYVVIEKNSGVYTPEESESNFIKTLIFTPNENLQDFYSIKLIDNTDPENYNIYNFTIKTIKPIINLFGVDPNGTTGGSVYALWDSGEEIYSATYSLNGNTQEYRKGQTLTIEGNYTITLTDELGNSTTIQFEIDKSINFVIADLDGKTYEIEDLDYINFDIKIVNNEPLNVTITKNGNPYDYEFGLMISEEGYYEIVLTDEFNNSIYFYFTIDKTPPSATLYGVEEFGKTNKSAWVVSNDTNLTCWYVVNEAYRDSYKLGEELTKSGKYVVYVADRANNFVSFEFQIDKEIAFDINTYRGGISNGGVRIIAYENLKIYMAKDEQMIDYQFEQILNDEGEYSFTITDELGNMYSSYFTIINKAKQNLQHLLQEDISIKSISKDNETYEYELLENSLYLYDEGKYLISIIDNKTNNEYSFEITLDTTPPTLEIFGVENGGKTKNVVVLKNVSETPYELIIYVDGVRFDYKLGDKIEKSGKFEITLKDEAGNTTTYSFEREYSFNAASIAVFVGLGVLVILLIILLIKSRHHYYKEKITEEEIKETLIDDDIDSNDSENTENQ